MWNPYVTMNKNIILLVKFASARNGTNQTKNLLSTDKLQMSTILILLRKREEIF